MSISIPIIDGLFRLIDKVIPDPQAKANAQLEMLRMQQAGEFKQIETELQLSLGQLEVNKAEAASGNAFASSWRPAVGWCCVIGLLYTYLAQPLLAWASGIWNVPAPPQLDLGDLLTLLAGMLGLGGLRTFEKLKGVARS